MSYNLSLRWYRYYKNFYWPNSYHFWKHSEEVSLSTLRPTRGFPRWSWRRTRGKDQEFLRTPPPRRSTGRSVPLDWGWKEIIIVVITSFSMKVLLDTELRPRKKWGVDAVESFMSPANLRSPRWRRNHFDQILRIAEDRKVWGCVRYGWWRKGWRSWWGDLLFMRMAIGREMNMMWKPILSVMTGSETSSDLFNHLKRDFFSVLSWANETPNL